MESKLYTLADLKSQASEIRARDQLSQSAALERLAADMGFRNWNTLRASALPWSVGDMVSGAYLGQRFRAKVLGLTPTGTECKLTLHFDAPVDVVTSAHFSNMRSRVTVMITGQGRTIATTSDGTPHLVLD